MDARAKILEAATKLFSTHGYENTSLSQIAKQASVSKALIFWHFETKENLFQAVLSSTVEPLSVDVDTDLTGLREPDQVKKLIDRYFEFVTENVNSVRFFFGLVLREERRPDDLVARIIDLHGVFRQLLAETIARGQENGQLSRELDPTMHGALILTTLNGVLVHGMMGDAGPPAREALLAQMKQTLVDRYVLQ